MKDELDNKECNHFFVFLEKMQMLELIIENVEILLEFGWSETNDTVMSPYVGEKEMYPEIEVCKKLEVEEKWVVSGCQ